MVQRLQPLHREHFGAKQVHFWYHCENVSVTDNKLGNPTEHINTTPRMMGSQQQRLWPKGVCLPRTIALKFMLECEHDVVLLHEHVSKDTAPWLFRNILHLS